LALNTLREARQALTDLPNNEEPGGAIADTWPGTDLVTTSGLGHHKILRGAEVIARSVDFCRLRLAPPRRLRLVYEAPRLAGLAGAVA